MMHSKIAVGIDLGTSNSVIAVYRNGKAEIISNDNGHRTTPSIVAFTQTCRLVGDAASLQTSSNSMNTITDIKRLTGRQFDDNDVQDELSYLSYAVKKDNKSGGPLVCVDYKGAQVNFTPEQISSMIIQKFKSTAETYLGFPVNLCVVTVPAYFNDAQRQATKDACQIAGLKVLRIINEPTAAAIAYSIDSVRQSNIERTILVFDLGGGTLDVSLLTFDNNKLTVKATCGNTCLGGNDFTNRIFAHFSKDFKRRYNVDVMTNKRAAQRLMQACERAKKNLSSSTLTSIEIDSIMDGIDFCATISREKFDEICVDLIEMCLDCIVKVIKDANISNQSHEDANISAKSVIDEIIMVGGSTRIPRLENVIRDFFGRDVGKCINPDEAVAHGAAIQAAILTGNLDARISRFLLCDVVPFSLGIEISGGNVSRLIKRNSLIPVRQSQIFSTHVDNQRGVGIRIYEGERAKATDNNLLGTFHLLGITPALKGVPQIQVTFEIDADGILSVSAVEKSSGISKTMQVDKQSSSLSKAQVEALVEEAKAFEEQDREWAQRVTAKNALEEHIYETRGFLDELKEKVESYIAWCESETRNKEEYDTKRKWMDMQIRSSLRQFLEERK